MNEVNTLLDELKRPETIRKKAHQLLECGKQGSLKHFKIDLRQLIPTASYVIEVMKNNYPTLDIPYHSRWRHFEVGNRSRIAELRKQQSHLSETEIGKILYELVIISVLLDAGAGPNWSYKEALTGLSYSRSEGLALASLELYSSGALSSDPNNPLRVDADKLLKLSDTDLMKAFQVTSSNPIVGLSGRTGLLKRLGEVIKNNPEPFCNTQRLGEFFMHIQSMSLNNALSITILFQTVLNVFGPIWPPRTTLNGVSLGDVWTHPALKTQTPGSEYIPFHKLSQWLTYSLIEPLEDCGIKVTDLDQLTGLPEYRNGGLLIDTGLLLIKNKGELDKAHKPGSEFIVEWRGLTVALLDELAILIREQLNCSKETLPLAKILQGGTWEAGRKIAKEKRTDGIPPLTIVSDGTVF